MGKQKELWEEMVISPGRIPLTGSHIVLIKCLKLFGDQVSLRSGCANVQASL